MESGAEEALRRRGAELVGLALTALAALGWALLWTYSPDDPSLFSATDEAPRNALGLVGASIADPLHRALGWAAYGAPLALMIWGLRLVLHAGESRGPRRAIALPVAMLAAAAFAAGHVPLAGWPHEYGLGGLLGDATLGSILTATPLGLELALALASVALGLIFVFTSTYALGVTWREVASLARLMGQGSVMIYSAALGLAGSVVRALASVARIAWGKVAALRARRAAADVPP
nr:DNA translocase FtsK 4TM domain-containing protein [Paracoccaceae bacterium]